MNKEAIKEFLKPDLRKSNVVALLLLLSLILHGLTYWIFFCCTEFADIFVLIVFAGIVVALKSSLSVPMIVIGLIFQLIYLHLISCLIIFSYDKFKNRR